MSRPSPVLQVIAEYMEKNKSLIANAPKRLEKERREWLKQQQESASIDITSWLLAVELHQLEKQKEREAVGKAARRRKV